MLSKKRNVFDSEGWTLSEVEDFEKLKTFDCGNDDLNEFFQEDCQIQSRELLNKTFELFEATEGDYIPVALISLSNDAVRRQRVTDWLKYNDQKKVYPFYPAVKIARLGVNEKIQGYNIGTHLINMIKTMFVTNNRTGCRFLTVDAYNEKGVLGFYEKNDFQFFSDKDRRRQQRAMFFDLKRLSL